jgi:hypothetical protein
MERINIKERRSQAKIAGTLITVGGALLMILFSGPVVNFPWSKHSASHAIADSASHSSGRWLMGIFMILLSCFCWSAFFILQVKSHSSPAFCFSCYLLQLQQIYWRREITKTTIDLVCDFQSHTLRSYPSELSLTTLICAMGVMESGAVALVMERDMKAWAIGFDMRLFTAVYSVSCNQVETTNCFCGWFR